MATGRRRVLVTGATGHAGGSVIQRISAGPALQIVAAARSPKKAGVKYIVHLGSPADDDTRVAYYGWRQFVERYIEW